MPHLSRKPCLLFLTTLVFTLPVYSQELEEGRPKGLPLNADGDEKDVTGWTIHFDNDLLIPGSRDQDYTGGLGITVAGSAVRDAWWSLDGLLGIINRATGFEQLADSPYRLHAAQFGLLVFSPSDISSHQSIYDDRPFANLIYMANSRRYINTASDAVYQSTFTLGVLGTDIGADIQNGIHKLVGSQPPEGWDHQISAGGEPTFQYSVNRQALLASNFQASRTEYELKYTAAGSVGYITEMNLSLGGRWGLLNTPWWSFTPENADYASQPAPVIGNAAIGEAANELYVWGGIKLRARLYNAFLQGQFRDSDVTFSSGDIRHLVGEAWVGITGQRKADRISYVIRFQTKEIKEGTGARDPVWAGFIFSHDM